MKEELKRELEKIAATIRQLSMDAIEKAHSGHPGLPLGCAEFGAYLYGVLLRHNPKNPTWIGRDRFILSAGHGSMLLYSCLYLSGFPLQLEDIKQFRQIQSKTPGHPECHITPGVEATTGPLGQGVANAVGQALGLKLLGAKFNSSSRPLFSNKVYCLAGDGCLMEGVSAEASSLAGHLKLDNLVIIHDDNGISLDGPLSESSSEDTKQRYMAYGFDVFELDGYSFDAMDRLFSQIKAEQTRPVFIQMKTVIGKGSPHKAGSHKVHGSPLGAEEVKETKAALGLPDEPFYVPQSVLRFFEHKLSSDQAKEDEWNRHLKQLEEDESALYQEFIRMQNRSLPSDLEEKLQKLEVKTPAATRSSSGQVVNFLGNALSQIYGGSADLSSSDMTMMKSLPVVTSQNLEGRNIKFGVREFAMAAAATGLFQTQMITPFIGTFLVFSDYMKNAIRLAAMSRIQVIYTFTHDSVFLGEDGPTHQPVEQLAALRAIPDLQVIRPAGTHEVKMAWLAALRYQGPTALILSRQTVADIPSTCLSYAEGMERGAYLVKQCEGNPHFTLVATGSELPLAIDLSMALEKMGKKVRVISMPCWELFEKQDKAYKRALFGETAGKKVSIEAAAAFGWHKWIGSDGIAVSVDSFGQSAPQSQLAEFYGFTVDAILARLI